MNSKLMAIVVLATTTAVACAKGAATGPGASGGATSNGSTAHTTSTGSTTPTTAVTTNNGTGGATASTTATSVTIASATTGTGPTETCDQIGVCQLAGNTNPTKDCVTCAVLGSTTMFTNGGDCRPPFNNAFGTDGMCGAGGFLSACKYLTCTKGCSGANGMLDSQVKWDCYCTNDQMGASSTCNGAQTNTATCLGALEADMPAYMAETSFEDCLYGVTGACVASCLGGG